MAALKLKALLEEHSLSQRALAQAVGISPAAVTQLVTHGRWPKRVAREEIKAKAVQFLGAAGIPAEELATAFDKASKANSAKDQDKEDSTMLLRRQGLFPATKQHFNLFRDPFTDDVGCHEDVFLSGDIRYVREAMLHTAKHGGFLAVIGESGSGKSTLRRDLIDRLAHDDAPVLVIEPYVLAMEDNDKKGKALRALQIAEAILAVVAPLERLPANPESRFRLLHRVLRDSRRAGQSHVLVIEEAHCLSVTILKHLKRFLELEDGFKRLLSIILLGQTELRQKLSETNHEVREVVQRCEIVELRALNGNLGQYLRHKFARVGVEDMGQILTEEGIEALKAKLTGPAARSGSKDSVSYCYPLAVGNVLTAAMNLAAEIGAPVVNADVIRQV